MVLQLCFTADGDSHKETHAFFLRVFWAPPHWITVSVPWTHTVGMFACTLVCGPRWYRMSLWLSRLTSQQTERHDTPNLCDCLLLDAPGGRADGTFNRVKVKFLLSCFCCSCCAAVVDSVALNPPSILCCVTRRIQLKQGNVFPADTLQPPSAPITLISC